MNDLAEEQNDTDETAPESHRGRRGGFVPWLIALVAVVTAAATTAQWRAAENRESERTEVAAAVSHFGTVLLNFDASDGTDDYTDALAELSTGAYLDELETSAQEDLQVFEEIHLVSTAEIRDVFVQAIDGDTATALLVADHTQRSDAQDPATSRRFGVVELQKVDGRWLVVDARFLVSDDTNSLPVQSSSPSEDDNDTASEQDAPSETG